MIGHYVRSLFGLPRRVTMEKEANSGDPFMESCKRSLDPEPHMSSMLFGDTMVPNVE